MFKNPLRDATVVPWWWGVLEGPRSALYEKRDPVQAFGLACARGDLAVAQALVAAGWDATVPRVFDTVFHETCVQGHLPVIQWLAGLNSERFAWMTEVGLALACEFAHLPLAQWLVQQLLHQQGRLTPSNLAYAFQSACEGGHMHMARWVLGLGDVDIHASCDAAFRLACMNGHMRVAKWLVGLGGVDIHAELDEALEHLVNIGREACRWYVSLVADSDVPKHLLALLKCWSPTRDAWMRSVVRAPQLP